MKMRVNLQVLCLVALTLMTITQAAPDFKRSFRRHMLPGHKFSQEGRQARNSKLMDFGRSIDEAMADPLSILKVATEDKAVQVPEVEVDNSAEVKESAEVDSEDVSSEETSSEVEESSGDVSEEVTEAVEEAEEAGEASEAAVKATEVPVEVEVTTMASESEESDTATEAIVKKLAEEVINEIDEEDRAGKQGNDPIGIHSFDMTLEEEKDFKIKLLEDQLKQVRNILEARSNGNFQEPQFRELLPNEEPVENRLIEDYPGDYEDLDSSDVKRLPSDFATNMGDDLLADPDNNQYATSPQIPANRQQIDVAGESPGELNDKGLRCMKKVMQVEETVYDQVQKCEHTFTEKCHETVETDYIAKPEKKCDTMFDKNCKIFYKPSVFQDTVQICHEPLETRCAADIQGENVCKTHYETVCETRYKEHSVEQDEPECRMETLQKCDDIEVPVPPIGDADPVTRRRKALQYAQAVGLISREKRQVGFNNVGIGSNCETWPVQKCDVKKKTVKKVNPETSCEKVPREICAPSNCEQVKAQKICTEEVRDFVQNLPEERCGLEPRESCRMETVMVPRLVPTQKCFKVPKEICVMAQENPKKVKRPVITEWCYDPNDLQENGSRSVLREIINTNM